MECTGCTGCTGRLAGRQSGLKSRDSLAVSFVQPNSFSIIYHGIFMARAFVSRNYAFIIQNAFYATQTNGTRENEGQPTPVSP